jgi:hypothetical protein
LAAPEEVQVGAQAGNKSFRSGASILAHYETQMLTSATPHQPLMNIREHNGRASHTKGQNPSKQECGHHVSSRSV